MTRIHRPREADDLADFAIEEQLQHVAQSSDSLVLVFPCCLPVVAAGLMPPTHSGARQSRMPGKTLPITSGEPIPALLGTGNSVIIIGDHARPDFHQRIPVLGGMWNPSRPQGGAR